jgi:hypothetical protein
MIAVVGSVLPSIPAMARIVATFKFRVGPVNSGSSEEAEAGAAEDESEQQQGGAKRLKLMDRHTWWLQCWTQCGGSAGSCVPWTQSGEGADSDSNDSNDSNISPIAEEGSKLISLISGGGVEVLPLSGDPVR